MAGGLPLSVFFVLVNVCMRKGRCSHYLLLDLNLETDFKSFWLTFGCGFKNIAKKISGKQESVLSGAKKSSGIVCDGFSIR